MIGLDPERRAAQSAAWRRGFIVAVAASVVAYVAARFAGGVTPGNVWGLSFGTAAMVLMVGVGAWGVRRRAMSTASRWHLGSSRTWILFHLYAGSLFVLVMAMHMAFHWPVGLVTSFLFWLSIVTVLSGFFGLFLQRWIPKALTSGAGIEVLYDRVPELVEDLRKRGKAAADGCEDSLVRALYEERLAEALAAPRRRLRFVFDPSGGAQSGLREFQYLKPRLGVDARLKLEELESIYRTKLAIDAHLTLQTLLRYWLYSHLPVSILAFAFLILHLYAVYAW
jgi:hypothetical protein